MEVLFLSLAFWLVLLTSPYTVQGVRRLGMVAAITNRRSHTQPTPHGGGIILVLAIVLCGLLACWRLALPHEPFVLALLLASIPLALVGWLDDWRDQPAWVRLGVQVACVAVALAFLPQLFDSFPLWLEKMILLLAWVWFVNLYNFMDGLDGLATSQAIFLSVLLALLVPALTPMCVIVAGACLGFLRVNWQPAQVFMGDVGSTFLGFILGGLLFLGVEWDTWRLVYPLFVLTLVFSADTTYTLFKLMRQRKKFWLPHREFWFLRAHDAGLSHAQVVLAVWGLNLGLAAVAFSGYTWQWGFFTVVLGLVWLLPAAVWVQRRENRRK